MPEAKRSCQFHEVRRIIAAVTIGFLATNIIHQGAELFLTRGESDRVGNLIVFDAEHGAAVLGDDAIIGGHVEKLPQGGDALID